MAEEIKKVTEKERKQAEKLIQELFDKLGITATAEVQTNEDTLDVLLQTEDSGILIGYHGETLESLQLIFSLAISKKVGRFIRITMDVGDYRKQRTEYLENLASQMKESVLREQRERVVTSLKAWERRVVHLLLQEDPDVVTESRGIGRDRVLVIKPK